MARRIAGTALFALASLSLAYLPFLYFPVVWAKHQLSPLAPLVPFLPPAGAAFLVAAVGVVVLRRLRAR